MFDTKKNPIVYYPSSLNEFFRIYRRYPDASVAAGGTYIISSEKFKSSPSRIFIFLTQIDELSKIYKTERYIEFGACVSLSSILDLGTPVLPSLMVKCTRRIATMPVRNMATVGGNLSVKGKKMDLSYIFSLMDAKIEVKSISGNSFSSRWVPVNQLLFSPEESLSEKKQIITRIRLYETGWNVSHYHKIRLGSGSSLIFCGLAHIDKGGITDFRCLIGSPSGSNSFIRSRALEMSIIGRSLPLSEKDSHQYAHQFTKDLELEALEKETIASLTENFITEINNYYNEEVFK